MAEDGEDFVGEIFGVPEIDFEDVLQDFGDAALFADDDRHIVGEGFERCDAERFADAGHDVDVGGAEGSFGFGFFEKAGEDDAAVDAEFFRQALSSSTMSPLPAMTNLNVGLDGEEFFRGLEEIAGAFLLGHSAEEENGLMFLAGMAVGCGRVGAGGSTAL